MMKQQRSMNCQLQLWFNIMVGLSGLTQRKFADKYGISNATVSRVVGRRRLISVKLFERILVGEGFFVQWKMVEKDGL
jgi:transcriptional regulator with XRE-family HTH domain